MIRRLALLSRSRTRDAGGRWGTIARYRLALASLAAAFSMAPCFSTQAIDNKFGDQHFKTPAASTPPSIIDA